MPPVGFFVAGFHKNWLKVHTRFEISASFKNQSGGAAQVSRFPVPGEA